LDFHCHFHSHSYTTNSNNIFHKIFQIYSPGIYPHRNATKLQSGPGLLNLIAEPGQTIKNTIKKYTKLPNPNSPKLNYEKNSESGLKVKGFHDDRMVPSQACHVGNFRKLQGDFEKYLSEKIKPMLFRYFPIRFWMDGNRIQPIADDWKEDFLPM
jgi:hypothetical protein